MIFAEKKKMLVAYFYDGLTALICYINLAIFSQIDLKEFSTFLGQNKGEISGFTALVILITSIFRMIQTIRYNRLRNRREREKLKDQKQNKKGNNE